MVRPLHKKWNFFIYSIPVSCNVLGYGAINPIKYCKHFPMLCGNEIFAYWWYGIHIAEISKATCHAGVCWCCCARDCHSLYLYWYTHVYVCAYNFVWMSVWVCVFFSFSDSCSVPLCQNQCQLDSPSIQPMESIHRGPAKSISQLANNIIPFSFKTSYGFRFVSIRSARWNRAQRGRGRPFWSISCFFFFYIFCVLTKMYDALVPV